MPDQDRQPGQFEHLRPRMRALAYPLLGSHAEAGEAVREVWVRLGRINPEEVADLAAWLTTVTARVCLSRLESRGAGTEGRGGGRLPDVVVGRAGAAAPGGSVGLALLVALEELAPAERVALVLHDVFGLHVDQIATALDRSTADTRKLAERARRRTQGAREADADGSPAVRRRLVEAFGTALRDGDPAALTAVLEPEAELRADGGRPLPAATAVFRGAQRVAERAVTLRQGGPAFTPVLVNGAPGALLTRDGGPVALLGLAVRAGRISRAYVLLDPDRLAAIDVAGLAP
ncbi:sigma factor-like helix-turn-helix DNA-binding protein [Kitasatospora sp. NPDC127059]|uniref:sigma factor-like helix-turn-helix DNA-binding protein n=1 Tax=unclassified Kitasatospora TaxID=2633591 RepID=UPI003647BEB0